MIAERANYLQNRDHDCYGSSDDRGNDFGFQGASLATSSFKESAGGSRTDAWVEFR
jgi:hypothetical protein